MHNEITVEGIRLSDDNYAVIRKENNIECLCTFPHKNYGCGIAREYCLSPIIFTTTSRGLETTILTFPKTSSKPTTITKS